MFDTAEPHIDSVMEILDAQCGDLESLLALARRETAAAENRDFEAIMEVVKERGLLSERLEVYHRQLAELRSQLGEPIKRALGSPAVGEAVSLIAKIQLQDSLTRPLLEAAKDELIKETGQIARVKRNLNAYSQEGRSATVACDKHI